MTERRQDTMPIRFRGWELRPAEQLLLVGGKPVPVGHRALDVLLALVERSGEVVTKSELLKTAWAGLVVEENNVSVQVAALRKALGARQIATVPGIGYRLTAARENASEGRRAPSEWGAHGASDGDAAPELLGRETELIELQARMRDVRVLNIVGSGGVGKTALARAFVARWTANEPVATTWVDLAPVRDGRRVVPLLAHALGIELAASGTEAEDLQHALGQVTGIVVLDNCEHVLDEVADIVRKAATGALGLQWLLTSQEPLHVAGEMVFRLAPLDVPPDGVTTAQAMEFGAIALLCQRVAAADRRFRLDDGKLESATEICRQLDGLPLAVEMAAASVAALGIDEVRQRLGQRMRLLRGGRGADLRHATLKAAFDWSHEFLSPIEQTVFRRLEPFLGGFRADMAQQVASDEPGAAGIDAWQALDALVALVEKSLVQRDPQVPGRFYLLESARDYARLKLETDSETATVQRRHAAAVATWFAHAQVDAERMTDAEWAQRYVPERHNALAALTWACRQRTPDDLARLVIALAMIDSFQGNPAEVLQCGIPFEVLDQAAPELRAGAYLELSWSHYHDGDRGRAAALAQDAFEVFTALGDEVRAYRALAQLTRLHEARPGMAAEAARAWERLQCMDSRRVPLRTRLFCCIAGGLRHRPDLTVDHMKEFERLALGAGFETLAAISRANLSDKLLIAGRDDEVVALARDDAGPAQRLPRTRAAILHNAILALVRLGRSAEAHAPARAAFKAMPSAAHFLVDAFALAAAREARYPEAAVLSGCSAHVRRERHERPDVAEEAAIAETQSTLERAMDAKERMELAGLGASMSPAEVLSLNVFAQLRSPAARGGLRAGVASRSSSRDSA